MYRSDEEKEKVKGLLKQCMARVPKKTGVGRYTRGEKNASKFSKISGLKDSDLNLSPGLLFFKHLGSLLDDTAKFRKEFFENEPLVVLFFTELLSIITSLTNEFESQISIEPEYFAIL